MNFSNTLKSFTKFPLGIYNILLGMFTVVKHTTRDPITSDYPN